MTSVEVRPVTTEAERQAFLRMPWQVYKDDPNWVAPLWKEHIEFFEPEHNVELRHIDMQMMVAWRGGQPVGTIIAFINHAYNEFHETTAGWFGQFEVLEDEEAAHALLSAAEAWLREQGAVSMMGPATFSTNSEIGMLIEGYDTPPQIMMRHDRPHAARFAESYGLLKGMDLLAWKLPASQFDDGSMPPKVARVVGKIKQRRNYELVTPQMRNWAEWVKVLRDIYGNAWAENWAYVPLNELEIEHLQASLKPMVDPNVVFFIRHEGEFIGFVAPIVNLYEPLAKANCKPGEPEWLQMLRLIWHWKVANPPRSFRVFLLGVHDSYRGQGLDALLFYEIIKAGLKRGYQWAECSWILETNDMMNRGIELLGAHVYKKYRVYEKQLH